MTSIWGRPTAIPNHMIRPVSRRAYNEFYFVRWLKNFHHYKVFDKKYPDVWAFSLAIHNNEFIRHDLYLVL
jgi:hypothetical protein